MESEPECCPQGPLRVSIANRAVLGKNDSDAERRILPSWGSCESLCSVTASEYFERVQASLTLMREAFPPFLVAGLGMVAAGLLLSVVRKWPVFIVIDELLILVPALLGLKGNLEMTLASRLGTHANKGELDTFEGFREIALGNLAVVQCQAIVVGFLASLVAFVLDVLATHTMHPKHMLLISASSVSTASLASFLLAAVMTAIVMIARHFGINPDNIASPIAGMLGDFCTLGTLSIIAQMLFDMEEDMRWIEVAIISGYVLLAVVFGRLLTKSESLSRVLEEGWKPVIMSMMLSSLAGLVLQRATHRFKALAPFAPVMNGAGGNLAAVQSSRLSTDLHCNGCPGVMPARRYSLKRPAGGGRRPRLDSDVEEIMPKATFAALFGRNRHAGSARVLICLSIPGALCFVNLIVYLRTGGLALPTCFFMLVFLMATITQVCTLFVFVHWIVAALWRKGVNPDNAAIPYVTSLGDFLGTICLATAFSVLTDFGGMPWAGAPLAG